VVEFQQGAIASSVSSAEESRNPSAKAAAPEPEAKNWLTAAVDQIDVLWITAGLGCDGDTISMTAATQPSIEELIVGALPGVPKVRLHNPFLDYKNGDDFLAEFHRAAEGKLERFILVIEGSIPDETNKPEGYWAGFGTDAHLDL
jgi:hydrogenase small subunit